MAEGGGWFRGLFGGQKNADVAPALLEPDLEKSFAYGNNDFTLAMYGLLRTEPGNLFVSPFSIRVALAMAMAGARGETLAQMTQALRMSSLDVTPHAAVAEFVRNLHAASGQQMEVANSLWSQLGAPLQRAFLDVIAGHYDGSMNVLDFHGDTETARTTINEWVEDKTRQKIRDLIPSGGLNADARLVLVNAIYFKGAWVKPFQRGATLDESFYLENSEEVQAPLMRKLERVPYLQADGYQAVDLAYGDCDLSMLVLLPDSRAGLQNLEEKLSERMLRACVAELRPREVGVFLPRFTITSGTLNLSEQLAALGMSLAFNRFKADFSAINGLEPPHVEALSISDVLHKTFVEVNEEGTEAAAATAVAMYVGSARNVRAPRPIPIFRADHPFLFAIRDSGGAILFVGRVTDPTSNH